MKYCLLLPTYNEEDAIEFILNSARELFDLILVVDGNSTDNTRTIAENLGAEVYIQKNHGKGDAVQYGMDLFLESNCDRLGIIDADGTCDVGQLRQYLEQLDQAIIVGNRFYNGKPKSMGWFSRFVNWLVSLVVSIRIRQRIKDVQSPFWCITNNAVREIRDGLNAQYFDIEIDMVIQAKKMKLKIQQQQIQYNDRIGESKFSVKHRIKQIFLVIYHIIRRR